MKKKKKEMIKEIMESFDFDGVLETIIQLNSSVLVEDNVQYLKDRAKRLLKDCPKNGSTVCGGFHVIRTKRDMSLFYCLEYSWSDKCESQ